MSAARTYRSRPVMVTAVQWTGDNESALKEFAGWRFDVLDAEDRANCDDPEATAQFHEVTRSTWKLVYVGDWIVRTGAGFVKMTHSAFTAQFDEVATEPGS